MSGISGSAERICEVRDLGLVRYGAALAEQERLVELRKGREIPDQLLFVEHPHVLTLGRNGRMENVLASPEVLEKTGIEFYSTNRGGDITYHGPGQLVGYPILDLREWKRDVVAYVRSLEQVLIDALAEFDIVAERVPAATGVWANGAKLAAIGVHISRWVTSHGFALNVDTDLRYFQYIVPCGLTKPVTSLRALGCAAGRTQMQEAIARRFGRVFACEMQETELLTEKA